MSWGGRPEKNLARGEFIDLSNKFGGPRRDRKKRPVEKWKVHVENKNMLSSCCVRDARAREVAPAAGFPAPRHPAAPVPVLHAVHAQTLIARRAILQAFRR